MMNFLPIQFDERALSQYGLLFSKCFPKSAKFSPYNLDWLYCKNPDGSAIGFDAWDGDRLAAHYVCVPARAAVGGSVVKTMLSLNTATHPEYQGKGLFTKLAEMTYETAAVAGIDAVFGVANANSTSGFVRKLGFQLVQPLDVLIGFGSLGIDLEMAASRAQFERVWSAEGLAWRVANPNNPVFSRRHGDRLQIHAAAFGKLLPAYAELPLKGLPHAGNVADDFLSPLRLFIGLVPDGACQFRRYVSIPQRLRPSPLNFIYRSLSHRLERLEKGHVSFSFLDFDAY